jgi:hypothetical protein
VADWRGTVGKKKAGSGQGAIFVVEESHVVVLRMQPTLEDPARKSWKAILDSRYFGPAKSGEREGRCREGNRFRGIRLHKPGNCGWRSHGLRCANGVKNGVRRPKKKKKKRLLCPGRGKAISRSQFLPA